MKVLKPTLFLFPLALLACATDPTTADDGELVDEAAADPVAAEPIAICAPLPTPPAYDDTFTLTSANPTHTFVGAGYGTSECSSYVAAAKNVQSFTARPFVYVDNALDCVRVQLSVSKFRKLSTGWQHQGSESETGVWTIDGCRFPSITYNAAAPDEARLDVRAKKTHCSGQFCGTTYGVPVVIETTKYVVIN